MLRAAAHHRCWQFGLKTAQIPYGRRVSVQEKWRDPKKVWSSNREYGTCLGVDEFSRGGAYFVLLENPSKGAQVQVYRNVRMVDETPGPPGSAETVGPATPAGKEEEEKPQEDGIIEEILHQGQGSSSSSTDPIPETSGPKKSETKPKDVADDGERTYTCPRCRGKNRAHTRGKNCREQKPQAVAGESNKQEAVAGKSNKQEAVAGQRNKQEAVAGNIATSKRQLRVISTNKRQLQVTTTNRRSRHFSWTETLLPKVICAVLVTKCLHIWCAAARNTA
jgi:hypothetical protein